VSVVCCQVQVSARGLSLAQRIPAECGVSECDREASKMRKPWPNRDCCTIKIKILPNGWRGKILDLIEASIPYI